MSLLEMLKTGVSFFMTNTKINAKLLVGRYECSCGKVFSNILTFLLHLPKKLKKIRYCERCGYRTTMLSIGDTCPDCTKTNYSQLSEWPEYM